MCTSGLCGALDECLYLHCKNDGDCDSNNCSSSGPTSGFCVNERCSKGSDCTSGLCNDNGICSYLPCKNPGDCLSNVCNAAGFCVGSKLPGIPCKNPGDCLNPSMRSGACGSNGFCAGQALGESCSVPSDCLTNTCINNSCALVEFGNACSLNSMCASGNCQGADKYTLGICQ